MKISLITREEFERKTKYWYFYTEYYCPVCGRTQVYKNRMQYPKPENWDDRHEEIEAFDYCNVL